jgi:hypothetical protein
LKGKITESDLKGLDPTVTAEEYAKHLKSQHEANIILANAGIKGQTITDLALDDIKNIPTPHICGAGCGHDFNKATSDQTEPQDIKSKRVRAEKSDPHQKINFVFKG